MSDYNPPEKKVAKGLPLWVMTFADLMTLLMCFFVLILSFSELDILKYKQLAGSMAHAFGVQREIEAKEPPKGINIIAREFSPGQPMPTPLNIVRQKTVADMRVHLEVGGQRTSPSPARRIPEVETPERETGEQVREQPTREPAEARMSEQELREQERELRERQEAIEQARAEIELAKADIRQREDALRALEEKPAGRLDDATADEILAAREARERQRRQDEDAERILGELEQQILAGSVDVERDGQKIIIRIREQASFASGSAEVVASFKPVLWRLGEIIEGMEGRVVVAGHTDDIPISTPRFRSNWELSSGRAVSVVHELLWQTAMPLERFLVQGHAETEPMATNATPEGRAQNRRVEIILNQGEDREAEREITQHGVRQRVEEEAPGGEPDSPVTDGEAAVEPEPVAAAPPRGADAAPQAPVPEETAQPLAAEAGTSGVTAEPQPTGTPPPFRVAPITDIGTGTARPMEIRPGQSGVSAGATRTPSEPGGEQEAP